MEDVEVEGVIVDNMEWTQHAIWLLEQDAVALVASPVQGSVMVLQLAGRPFSCTLRKWPHLLRAGLSLHTLLAAGCLTSATHVLAGFLAPCGAAWRCQFSVPRSSSEGRCFTHLVQPGSRFAFALLCLTVTGAR